MRLGTILVPTDFSETADHALAQAVELGARHRATLHLLHAVEPYGEPPRNLMAVVRDHIATLEHDAETTLAEKAEAIRDDGVDVRYSIARHLAPFDAISDEVDRMGPDLVVIGTHGRRGFQRLLLGSVAEKTLRTASTNVLTTSLEAPLVKRERSFARILVPVDFSEFSKRSLETAFSLLADDGAISLVHVVDSPAAPAFYPVAPARIDDELQGAIRDNLSSWLHGREAEISIREGNVFHEILDACEKSDAELIVMGTHGLAGLGHVLLGSVTEKVVRRAQVPVWTVH